MPAEAPSKQHHKEFTITQLHKKDLHTLAALNYELFQEQRIINRTNHAFMVILVARLHDIPVGFKIGYGRSRGEFYSAKGGVMPRFRRQKLASRMLDVMMEIAAREGYRSFVYDTFPNKHKGMAILGFQRGFKLVDAKYNARYNDYQLTLQKQLTPQP